MTSNLKITFFFCFVLGSCWPQKESKILIRLTVHWFYEEAANLIGFYVFRMSFPHRKELFSFNIGSRTGRVHICNLIWLISKLSIKHVYFWYISVYFRLYFEPFNVDLVWIWSSLFGRKKEKRSDSEWECLGLFFLMQIKILVSRA